MNTLTLPPETVTDLVHLRETDIDEFHAFVLELTKAKWSLRVIGEAIGVSHSIVKRWKDIAIEDNLTMKTQREVPQVPKKEKASSSRPTKPEIIIPEADKQRIQELIPLASMVRGRTPQDSPYRQAAHELEDLLAHWKSQDVSYKTLAEIGNVSRRAIAQRLEAKARRDMSDNHTAA